jgi:hypothetical protein
MTFKAVFRIVCGTVWDLMLVAGVATFVELVLIPWRTMTGAM